MDTNYVHLEDVSHAYLLTKNWCDRFFPQVAYKVLELDENYVDDVHDEIVDVDKTFGSPVMLRAFVLPAEQAYPLTVFGIEELRDVILQVSVPNLIEVGLATQDSTSKEVVLLAKVGDRFLHTHNTEYEILTWKIGRTLGNTDTPIFFFASAEKLRRESTEYQTSCASGCETSEETM